MRCVSRDGTTTVECIQLSCTGTGRDGEWLRVKRGGYHLADVRTVRELAALGIDVADLTEVDLLPEQGQVRPCSPYSAANLVESAAFTVRSGPRPMNQDARHDPCPPGCCSAAGRDNRSASAEPGFPV
jgi:hypothetical protein